MSILTDAKRIVIKVGTSTLTHKTGMTNIRRVEQLVKVISDLKNSGKEIVLVTSGAIGVGVGKLGLIQKPTDMPTKQACAAVGQSDLMYMYDRYFTEHHHNVAQVLLTRDIIEDADRRQHVVNTLCKLIEMNIIPIVNENDTVAVEEIEFGDNDTLSAIVGELVSTDLLLILSDVDGMYNGDPRADSGAQIIRRIHKIDDELKTLAGGKGTELATGGMLTKLHAAEYAMKAGFPMVLLNGTKLNQLYELYDGAEVGTIFQNGK